MVKRSHTSSQNLLHPFFLTFMYCGAATFIFLLISSSDTHSLKEHFRHLCFYIIKMCVSRVLKSSVRRLVSVLSVFSLLPSLGAVSTGVVVLVLSRR